MTDSNPNEREADVDRATLLESVRLSRSNLEEAQRIAMQDVTEQRRLESQLAQAQRLEAVGQLAGGIAHDFNNLLTAIRGYAQLAAESLAEGEQARDDIEQVIRAADRAADLTRQLLAFSRRQVLQPQVVDPAEIVASISPMLRRLLGEHIELTTRAQIAAGSIRVDPSQFEQVIVNLALNARDAMPEGGRLTIETSNVELDAAYAANHADTNAGSYVALVVSDTGTGMDAATKVRIFDPFFTTKESGGTGMGLATVYGIVRQSGGSIYVYSEPGHGTSFKLYLPRVDVEPAIEPSGSATATPTGAEVILLVEDEEPVRAFAARILSGLGYTLLEASNGEEGLEVAAAHDGPIDLLLTDVTMPGMQGPQLAAAMRKVRPEIRVMYISGFTETLVGRPGSDGDGSTFLSKPFAGASLARAVRETLDRSS
jgi:signal transduction histidine kinase/ActR/RegA family two-component response regulator